MPDTVIKVEHLSKYYRLGLIGGGTLREDVNRMIARIRGKPDPTLKIGLDDHGNRDAQEIWALRDVNLAVEEGEILGIIGRNGAGNLHQGIPGAMDVGSPESNAPLLFRSR